MTTIPGLLEEDVQDLRLIAAHLGVSAGVLVRSWIKAWWDCAGDKVDSPGFCRGGND